MSTPYYYLKHHSACVMLCILLSFGAVFAARQVGATVGPNLRFGPYSLVSVADGDTLTIRGKSGKYLKVRMIGVDAPEIAHGKRPAECGGDSAKKHLALLLGKQQLFLKQDSSQDTYDKYKRRLAFVYAGDVLINQAMITDGYAYEYTYKKPHAYQATFRNLQTSAEKSDKGIWGMNCENKNEGNRTKRF
jgi:micrococcal nuclease